MSAFALPHLPRHLVKAAGVALAAAASTLALPTAHAAAAGGQTYYVSPSGSDANSGTDANHPFQSLAKVSNGFLQAGDTVRLQGGATFNGKLALWSSGSSAQPITVDAYGSGKPAVTGGCIDVGGSYITVQNVLVTGCDMNGIWLYGSNDVVQNTEITHDIQGIAVDQHAQGAQILNNYVHNNDRMAPNTPGPYDDFGAIGIVVDGDNTLVAHNTINDNSAPSADFGVDGSAVEIYGGIGTVVEYNMASNNETFTELGNPRTANTTFRYNQVTSSLNDSEFLITRGAGDAFGPVASTQAYNNSVMLTGPSSRGFICAGCTANMFNLYNNVLDVAGQIGDLAGTMTGRNNVYFGSKVTFPTMPGDVVGNPNFNIANGQLLPTAQSPMVDAGVATPVKVDLDGNTIAGTATDIGAYELNGTHATTHKHHRKHRHHRRHRGHKKDGHRHHGHRPHGHHN